MNSRYRAGVAFLVAALAVTFSLAGCKAKETANAAGTSNASAVPAPAADIDAKMQKVRNDPAMPPQAKAAALAAMEQARSHGNGLHLPPPGSSSR